MYFRVKIKFAANRNIYHIKTAAATLQIIYILYILHYDDTMCMIYFSKKNNNI